MDLQLSKKTIFITGGNSGIGKAIALAYAKEAGARIAISYFTAEAKALEIVAAIERQGCQAMAVKMDLANLSSIEQAVRAIIERFGSIDILINNAVIWGSGENRGKSFEQMPLSVWQSTVGLNLFGTVKVTQMVIPYMKSRRFGRIVTVSSDLAVESMHGSGPYSSLKAALFGLTANLVSELSEYNILSNVVLPSWTLTEKAKTFFPEDFQKEAIRAFPTNRITEPEQVATLVVYLGSPANGHVNGEYIKVSGKGSQYMLGTIFRELNSGKTKQ